MSLSAAALSAKAEYYPMWGERLTYTFSNSNASKTFESTCRFSSKTEVTSQKEVRSLNTFECVHQAIG